MSTIKVAHQPSSKSSTNKTNVDSGHSFPSAPHSPTKDALRPNAHPYAIKTTSTALLSRSNSSPQHAAAQHHYIPQPPPSPVKDSSEKNGGRHRYSRSLTSNDLPRPLPVPVGYPSSSPTHADFASDDVAVGLQQTGGSRDYRRSETLPTSLSSLVPAASVPPELGLPEDPKSWTPSQLAAYLATPFGLRGLRDAHEAKAVADIVEDKKISGRAFLRLNEDDLERHALPPTWRLALLTSSRDLRQAQLQKRIWGSSSSTASYTNASYVHPSRTRTRSDSMSSDVSDASAHSSVSASSSRSGVGERGRGSNGNGRVKGMVQNFERTSSVDEGHDSSFEGHRYSRSLSPNKRMSTSSNTGTAMPRTRPGSAIFPSQTGGPFPTYPKGDYMPERGRSESPEAMHRESRHENAQWLLSRSTGSPKKESRLLPYPPVPPILSPAVTGSEYGSFSPQVTGLQGGFTPQVTGHGSFTPQPTGDVSLSQSLGSFTLPPFSSQVHSYDYALASVHPASRQGDFEPSNSLLPGHGYTGVEGRPLPYPPHEAQLHQTHDTGRLSISGDNQADIKDSISDTSRDTNAETAGYDTALESSSPTAEVHFPLQQQSDQHDEEPSIEELLALESGASRGAEAWELDLGDTVKKLTSTGRVTGRKGRTAMKGTGIEEMFVGEERGRDAGEGDHSSPKGENVASISNVQTNSASESEITTAEAKGPESPVNEDAITSEEDLERRRQEAYALEQEMERERVRLDAIELERQRNVERERLALEEQERLERVQREAMELEAAEAAEHAPVDVVAAAESLPEEDRQLPAAASTEESSVTEEYAERRHQLMELELQESRLSSEVATTRRIAEELQSRIEAIEKKIEGMEERQRQRSQEPRQELPSQSPPDSSSISSFLVRFVRTTLRTVVVPILGERTPGIVTDFVGQPPNRPMPPPERRRKRDVIVSKGGYVVLFSIGMCAVVLRVLLQKTAAFGGKRLGAR